MAFIDVPGEKVTVIIGTSGSYFEVHVSISILESKEKVQAKVQLEG